jgi:polyhydroxyalkanoate synthesis regulator phasin
MTEEVEVKVTEVEESAPGANKWIIDGMRRLLLASFGAVAMTFDEVEAFVKKLVERGELAQKDAEKLLHEMQQRLTANRPQVEKVSDRSSRGWRSFSTG